MLRLLDTLSDSDIDLSDDETGEADNEFLDSAVEVRVGADKIGPQTKENVEQYTDEAYDDEDNLPLSMLVGCNRDETITAKSLVKWHRHAFNIPEIVWVSNENEEDVNLELFSPLKYFYRYIGETEFQDIAQFTNMYALQKGANFKPTNAVEIKSLFGLHIAVGTLKFPRVRLFWNTGLRINLFHETMTRDRFFQLRSNLHCVNNLEIPENCQDRLYKVRPLYDALRRRCLELQLEENLCIDEQIVPFRGNLSIKQYVKGKPTPWGIKIFVLCGKSGMAYDFLIYQGATTELDPDNLKKFGLGASVVLHLVKRIDNEGHKLYFDNYFPSYQLLQILKANKIFAAGTIRINRFSNPPVLGDKELKRMGRGSYDEVTSGDGDVVLVKWLDNRSVVLASNFIGSGNIDEVSRWDKGKKKYISVTRPEIVKLYNHSMGGVDLLDQMIGLYRIYIRSRKWTLRVIFHAVDLAVVNSWFEYRRDCERLQVPKKKQLELLDFRLYLADCLCKVGKEAVNNKRGRPSSGTPEPTRNKITKRNDEIRPLPDVRHDTVDHLPFLDGNQEGKRCKYNKCNKKTHFYCKKCNVHLCIKKDRNCFVGFHKNINRSME